MAGNSNRFASYRESTITSAAGQQNTYVPELLIYRDAAVVVSPASLRYTTSVEMSSSAHRVTLSSPAGLSLSNVTYAFEGGASSPFAVTKVSDTEYDVVFNAPATSGTYTDKLIFSYPGYASVEVALTGVSVPHGLKFAEDMLNLGSVNMGRFSDPVQLTATLEEGFTADEFSFTVDNPAFIVEEASSTADAIIYNVWYNATPEPTGVPDEGTVTFTARGLEWPLPLEGLSVNPFGHIYSITHRITTMGELPVDGTPVYMAAEYAGQYVIAQAFNPGTSRITIIKSDTLTSLGAMPFTFTDGTGGGYNISSVNPSGSTDEIYLGAAGNNTSLNMTTLANQGSNYWNVSCNNGYYTLGNSKTTKRALSFNAGSENYGNYATSNTSNNYVFNLILFTATEFRDGFPGPTTYPAQGATINWEDTENMYIQFASNVSNLDGSKVWINIIPEVVTTARTVAGYFTSVPTEGTFEAVLAVDADDPTKVSIKPATSDSRLLSGVDYRIMVFDGAFTTSDGVVPQFGWEFTVNFPTAVERIEATTGMRYDGRNITAATGGVIMVYNLGGVQVARGNNSVDMSRLARGIYIARCGNSVMKVVKR